MIPAAYERRIEAVENRIRLLAATNELPTEEIDEFEAARQVAFLLARAMQGRPDAVKAGREIAEIIGAGLSKPN